MKAEYQLSAEEVLRMLGSDAARGLSTAEARARLGRYGLNQLVAERPARNEPVFGP